MSLADDLAAGAAQNVRRARPEHPKGWEPGVVWGGNGGTVTTPPIEGSPDWRSVIEAFELNPDEVEIVEPVQFRTWDAAVGNGEVRRMRYWRANVRSRRATPDAPDVRDLLRHVKRQRTTGPSPEGTPVRSFALSLNDWQIGKEGTAQAVERIRDGFADGEAHLRRVMAERPVDRVILPCVGDLFEGCRDHYANQSYTVELNNRDQGLVVRKLLLEGIDRFRRILPVLVPAVGGNHGEERSDGQAYTDTSDNKDVAAVEQVAEVCAANPSAYGNVSFLLTREELTLTFDAAGTIVAMAHGHKFPNSSDPVKSIQDWWKGQMYGFRAPGDADLLLSAHKHKFLIVKDGRRTIVVAPTVDSGSRWWAESRGNDSQPAMLAMTLAGGGWDDIRLL